MKQLLVKKVGVSKNPASAVGDHSVLYQFVFIIFVCQLALNALAPIYFDAFVERSPKKPHHVKRFVKLMCDQGMKGVWDRVTGMVDTGAPTGYSASGEVVAADDLVNVFAIEDRVACAGAGIANQAEYIDVAVNLAVKISIKFSSSDASRVALGAKAIQGVRRPSPKLVETFVIIAQGILGRTSMQLLRANGCRVIGAELDSERVALAQSSGMNFVLRCEDTGRCIQELKKGCSLLSQAPLIFFGRGANAIRANRNTDTFADVSEKIYLLESLGLNL